MIALILIGVTALLIIDQQQRAMDRRLKVRNSTRRDTGAGRRN